MANFKNDRIPRLITLWFATPLVVSGCSTIQYAQPVVQAFPVTATIVAVIAVVLLVTIGRKDLSRRGVFLGIILGAIAEIVVARRIPADWWPSFLAAAFGVVSMFCVTFLFRRFSDINQVDGRPSDGLLPYFVTFCLLLSVDVLTHLSVG